MRRRDKRILARFSISTFILMAICMAGVLGSPGKVLATVSEVDMHDFIGGPVDGAYPVGSLVASSDGNTLYGVSQYGGANGTGSIFSIKADGTGFTNLYDFSTSGAGDGLYPSCTLVATAGGILYGVSPYGGAYGFGTIFSFNTNWGQFADLYDFMGPTSNDGANPVGSLVISADGTTLYGTTQGGGASGSLNGAIFSYTVSGTYTLLHSMGGGVLGAYPVGALVLTGAGAGTDLYGMAQGGDTPTDYGVVFHCTQTGGSFTVIYSFSGGPADGANPLGSLLYDSNGPTLYGMTQAGGASGYGTIFQMTTAGGSYHMYSFTGSSGAYPNGSLVLQGTPGSANLYGMTQSGGANDYGAIFTISDSLAVDNTGNAPVIVYSFAGGTTDGSYPVGSLLIDAISTGHVAYGMTPYGGLDGMGVIFSYTDSNIVPVGGVYPGAPTVTATRGDGQASFSFSPTTSGASHITSYPWSISPAPNSGSPTGTAYSVSASPIVVTNLGDGTAYTFKMWAVNASGTSATYGSATVTPAGVPGAPTIGTATAKNTGALVSFTAPTQTGGSAITGYTVTSNPTASGATYGATSPITVTGLTNGQTYNFTVTATNAAGNTGPSSGASNYVVPTALPGPPTIGTATSSASASAAVSFTAPVSAGLGSITNYTITSNPGNLTATTAAAGAGTVIGLTNGQPYTFTVTATNSSGTGAASAPSNNVTPAGPPGIPTIGTATAGDSQAMVNFTAPTSTGGAPIRGYTVVGVTGPGYTGTGAGSVGKVTYSAGSASPITVPGLTNGTSYKFTVAATNINGLTGTASGTSNAVTPAAVPVAPGVTATGGNAKATIAINTPPLPSNLLKSYTAVSSPGSLTGSCAGTGTAISVTSLTNGQAYTFSVTATNVNSALGLSATTNSVTPAGPPDQPTGATATANSTSTALITFTAPAPVNGSPIDHYTVVKSKVGGATSTVVATTSPSTPTASPITVTGLTTGTSYQFTVAATNTQGTTGSASTATAPAVTPGPAPNAPTSVVATAGGTSGKIKVTFTAPSPAPVNSITGYTVSATSGGPTVTATGTAAGTNNPIILTGLTDGTAYGITVYATNGTGNSPTAAPSPSTVTSSGPLSAPTGLSATPGNASATISFTAPPSTGIAIDHYNVTQAVGASNTYSATGTAAGTANPIVVGTAAGLGTLANGSAYKFELTAVNANSTSAVSLPTNSVTPTSNVPTAPTYVVATSGNGQATITFSGATSSTANPITSYTVSAAGGGATVTASSVTDNTPVTVSPLSNGTAYTITVTATNSLATSPPSTYSCSVTPATVPGAPTGVTATAGDGTATVTYSPPVSNGGSAITSYTATSSPGGLSGTSAGTSISLSPLSNGTAYTFSVAATNGVNTGPVGTSNSVTPLVTPSPPTGVSATVGTGQVTPYAIGTVNFTNPISNGTNLTFTVALASGTSIPGITGTAGTGSSGNDAPITTYTGSCAGIAAGAGTNIPVMGLSYGTAVSFVVTASNPNGTTVTSGRSSIVTPKGPLNAPTIGTATATGTASALVTFTAPASNGNTISSYTATSSPGSLTGTCGSGGTSIPVTALTDSQGYTFTVTAFANGGLLNSPPSNSSNQVVTGPPSAPSIGAVTKTGPTATTATVNFTPPSGFNNITNYTVVSSIQGTSTTGGPWTGSASPIVATGLSTSTPLTFTVAATNSSGMSGTSNASNVWTVVPGPPTGVTTTAGDGQATVGFTAPTQTGGLAISYYTATAAPVSGPGLLTGTAVGAGTAAGAGGAITVTGLVKGTTYNCSVTASNTMGTGNPSTSAPVVLLALPLPPTGLTAVPGPTTSQATVYFTPSASNGGSTVTSYTVAPIIGGVTGTNVTTVATGTNANLTGTGVGVGSIIATGLGSAQAYNFSVSATTAVGTSYPSLPSNAVTVAVPSAPTGVSGSVSAHTVTFTAPAYNGGSPITAYQVIGSGMGTVTVTLPGGASPIMEPQVLTLYFPSLTGGAVTVSATNDNVHFSSTGSGSAN